MDSLASYASDGENSNNSEELKMSYEGQADVRTRRASDANYDPVQMDMSEESNNNNSSGESGSERAHSPAAMPSALGSKTDSSRISPSSSDQRRSDNESNKDEHKRSDRSDRNKHSGEKNRRSSYDDRRQRGDNSNAHNKDTREKRSRDDEKKSRDEDKRKEKSDEKDHHYRDDSRRDRTRESRNDRDRRRDRERERERRHSRDERSKDRYREERSSYHKEKDRTRSRSRSRDRAPLPFRTMSYREEKGRNKLAQLEKLGIELKAPEGDTVALGIQSEQNYYNPLTTATQGKYAEQIQKRKLLWANKSKQEEGKGTSNTATTANTWMGTTFTHDQDGKVTAKFKRLMGIKGDLPNTQTVGTKPDILKKQEEMFNNMEQQYEVARATTHTQRGVGLGYSTGGYQFPR
ncbi:PREDICTED: arginine/serine-rich coiled-coil protein 2 isoform X1 [Polistes dominula]|uniref:Arginine/serine-rich coiled-coil protein 2 isoform X1 n=1 Tax=Polistes dominula TaxID=743375 RepID=A0ABM1IUC9_POLDO|nr:PREDICTED: arginine/serine-rich coiled-coil protein 2 isoform X1 [Polistes dominula]